ncbi:MAG: DegT/DnrJ/EryC1/StrS family aminotransferase [Actinomycetia bacterium]|nr:DegT/DnrJ/EryC1/StrS family aminotransferase [Actinomycetes bacterium]
MRIDFSPPDISEADIQAVSDALRSGWITTGPRAKALEADLAGFCATSRVACLSSATAALECVLRLLGVGPGDEVVTSAYTYTASASPIVHVGARPVLVDVPPGSYHMAAAELAAAVNERTKAVIAVDIAGVMCDYDALAAALAVPEVAARYRPQPGTLQTVFGSLPLIADGAHSLGASYKGRASGSVADFTAFSFHAVKNLTSAEGGALTWRAGRLDDDEFYQQVMLYSLHGQSKDALSKASLGSWEYDVLAPLYKCNMTDMAAALAASQLARYPELLARRQQLITAYRDGLVSAARAGGYQLDILEHNGANFCSSGHLLLVRLLGRDEAFRNRVIEALAARGVAANVHYKPLPLLTAYRNLGFDIRDFPQAYAQYQNEVSLPLHTRLTDAEVQYVCDCFAEAYAELSEP